MGMNSSKIEDDLPPLNTLDIKDAIPTEEQMTDFAKKLRKKIEEEFANKNEIENYVKLYCGQTVHKMISIDNFEIPVVCYGLISNWCSKSLSKSGGGTKPAEYRVQIKGIFNNDPHHLTQTQNVILSSLPYGAIRKKECNRKYEWILTKQFKLFYLKK